MDEVLHDNWYILFYCWNTQREQWWISFWSLYDLLTKSPVIVFEKGRNFDGKFMLDTLCDIWNILDKMMKEQNEDGVGAL